MCSTDTYVPSLEDKKLVYHTWDGESGWSACWLKQAADWWNFTRSNANLSLTWQINTGIFSEIYNKV